MGDYKRALKELLDEGATREWVQSEIEKSELSIQHWLKTVVRKGCLGLGTFPGRHAWRLIGGWMNFWHPSDVILRP